MKKAAPTLINHAHITTRAGGVGIEARRAEQFEARRAEVKNIKVNCYFSEVENSIWPTLYSVPEGASNSAGD